MSGDASPPRDAWLAGEPPADPLERLAGWIAEARASKASGEPDAAALATVGADGKPAVRIVLVRGFDPVQGVASFYTDQRSRKGRDLAAHPFAALAFHWQAFGRQARLEGPVTRADAADSDAYFASRHPESRIAASASEQSAPIASRADLIARYETVAARYPEPDAMPRPPEWGGYRLWIERIELWASRPHRLHDRLVWTRTLQSEDDTWQGGPWHAARLMP